MKELNGSLVHCRVSDGVTFFNSFTCQKEKRKSSSSSRSNKKNNRFMINLEQKENIALLLTYSRFLLFIGGENTAGCLA